ncbi:MAG: RecX family transcriptional regulator, partial [Ruminococcus sp.]|nr:RecX family transcriptional regulator [Ruminococcus sp.]
IGEYLAEDVLQPYKESFKENLIYLIETKYARLLTDGSDRKSVEKVKNSLVRYGYGFDEINHTIREYFDLMED